MACTLTYHLHNKIRNSARILRNNRCLYAQKNRIPSREFSSTLPSKHHIIPCLRAILKHNQRFYPLKSRISTRKFSSVLSTKYDEHKYGELRNRLAEIPYVNLIDKEADKILQDLCYDNDEELEDVLKWFSKVFNYNVRNNESLYPTTLLKSYCTYGFTMDDLSWKQWDSDAWRSAVVLAWCIKLILAYINMMDDIMDNSMLRNCEPCWYKKPDVGLLAVNDSVLIQSATYRLLQKHFAHSKCYMNIGHEIIKSIADAAYGQCMIGRSNYRYRKQGFDKLTFEWYETLSKYKSTPLGVSLPVLLGMHLAGGCTPKEYDFAKKLSLKLGLYNQSQDDYTDCFGNNELELTGMMGNDIREGNCTWFSVKFLEKASEPMKKQFLENYGVDDNDAVSKVLELYKKEKMSEKFEEFEEQSFREISSLIESMNDAKGYLFYDLFADTRKHYREIYSIKFKNAC